MSTNHKDVTKGLRVASQIMLDQKASIESEAVLKDLGPSNNLVYTYPEGQKIYCRKEQIEYIWKENKNSKQGLLDTDFIYPVYSAIDGVDYSNRKFNFFPPETIDIPDYTPTTISAGNNVTITGNGLPATPFVINSIPTVVTGSETKLSPGQSITITGNGTINTPYVINSIPAIVTGSETKVTQGQNVTITGNGTPETPYIINAVPTVVTGAETKLLPGQNVTISGNGTSLSPYLITAIQNPTVITVGTGLEVFGAGTSASPYVIATAPLQKTITGASYAVTNTDNNYTIIIQNGTTPMTINVPSAMASKIGIGFIQEGSADVTFVGTGGATILTAAGLKIKGINQQVFLEKVLDTSVYHLLGNTKV